MGTSLIVVKMPGGNVKIGNYQDTSDVCFPELFDTIEEGERARKGLERKVYERCVHEGNPKDLVEAEVFCDYGRGFYWTAFVNKEGSCIVERLTPSGGTPSFGYWGEEDGESWGCIYEVPEWVKQFFVKNKIHSLNPELNTQINT